jgi:hypothetical protein
MAALSLRSQARARKRRGSMLRHRALQKSGSNWQAIRDLQVREAGLQAAIDLRRLEEERKALEERKTQVEEAIALMGKSEASLRLHQVHAHRWGWLTLLAAGIAVASAWWTVNWFLTLSWEKALLTATLFVLPLIGWAVLLRFAHEQVAEWDLRKVFAGLGCIIIFCSVTAVASLGAARMLGVGLQEEQQEVRQFEDEAPASKPSTEAKGDRVERVKRLLNRLTMIAVVLLSIAGEVAAGLAYHEYSKHRDVVRIVGPFYRKRESIANALAANAAAQEAAKRGPDLLHARLTTQGLRAEAAAERRMGSLVPTVKWVAIAFGILVSLLLMATVALGAPEVREVTVVLLDLSTSVGVGPEFEANVRAVDRMIRGLPAGGARLAVFGINQASFGNRAFFTTTSPQEAGRFREYLDKWQDGALRAWQKVASGLQPIAPGSDLLGGVSRASIEFEEVPRAKKRLVLLSDMRQVGRGLNFERPFGEPRTVLARVHREGLIPDLHGVEVSVLGASTAGIDERHWRGLKTFWTDYFKQAGAELKVFTPNHR